MKRLTFLFLAICVSMASAQTVPMTNDECTTAIAIFDGINPSPPLGLSGNRFTNVGSLAPLSAGSPAMCGAASGSPGENNDVWFLYSATVTGVHNFQTCLPAGFLATGNITDTVLQVLDASVCPPVVALGCDDDTCTSPTFNSSLNVPLTAGNNYFIRVASWSPTTTDGTFYLRVTAPIPPPANDECSSPVTIFDGVNPNAPAGTSGVLYNSTGGTNSAGIPAACVSISADVWFTYTATASGTALFSTCTPVGFSAGSITDTVVQIFDTTTCPPTTSIGCNDDSCSARSNATAPVVSGQSYLIRVGTFGLAGAGGTFYLSVSYPPPPPANDGCATPTTIVDGENGPYDNSGATTSGTHITPDACSAGSPFPGLADMFFEYTASCTGNVTISTCDPVGFVGTNDDTQITVYGPGNCPTPAGLPIACNDDFGCGPTGFQSQVNFPITSGTAYLVRVASWSTNVGTFKITVHTAAALTVGPGCSDGGGAGPTLAVDALPILGNVITLSISGAGPNAGGFLLVSGVSPGPQPLPGGCNLYVDNLSLSILNIIVTDALGDWGWTIGIPNAPYLACGRLTLQGVIFPGVPFYQTTDGLELTLGY